MVEQPAEEQESGGAPDPRFFRLHNRITRLEKRLNSFDDRIQMVESDLTEKHKEIMERVTTLNSNISKFKTETVQLTEFIERVNRRISEFASKESVKTLEKYINLWNPLDYLSKSEISKLINETIGNQRTKTDMFATQEV